MWLFAARCYGVRCLLYCEIILTVIIRSHYLGACLRESKLMVGDKMRFFCNTFHQLEKIRIHYLGACLLTSL